MMQARSALSPNVYNLYCEALLQELKSIPEMEMKTKVIKNVVIYKLHCRDWQGSLKPDERSLN